MMEKNGYWTPFEKKDDLEQYYFLVRQETKKHLPRLFSEWDGKCYYFGYELTRHNVVYDPYSVSIDHKISIFYGFHNDIDPITIGSYNNLCICSRIINTVKNKLTEEEFYESDRYKLRLEEKRYE